MKDFQIGLMTQYNSDDGSTLRGKLPGGMGLGQRPVGTVFPHGTYSISSGSTDFTMPNETHEVYDVTFSLWTDERDPDDLTDAGEDLKTLYDDVAFSVTGKLIVYALRQGENLVQEPEEDGWGYHLRYSYRLG